jgi:SSS family solute:Na+ symporter
MNFTPLDWIVLALLFGLMCSAGWLCRRYARGVAEFLVAGRSLGRYIGVGAASMTGLGAVTILAMWQIGYKTGFAGLWWGLLGPLAGMLVGLTGFGIYRFRETRAMTLGQLVEMRYGRRTRVLFGLLAYAAGVLNMGIFPAVSAGFFIHYLGLPGELAVAGLRVPTLLVVMLIAEGTSVALCFWGGQITLVVTDFLQSVLVNLMLIVVVIYLARMFSWQQVATAFSSAPAADALIHPYRAGAGVEVGKVFFLIAVFWMFYNVISWSPDSMAASSARDAHEARMMRVFVRLKELGMLGLGLALLPIAAFVLLHHPDFAAQAAAVKAALAGIANAEVRSQMIVPAATVHILPPGLLGAFAGVVLFAYVSTEDGYMLAWGGLLVQDVIIPLRGRPLEPTAHLRWIRASILLVAIFIVTFSMLFKQVDNIYMFFDISASLYIGAAGVVVLGALYWRRATTAAAWTAMLAGAALSLAGFWYRSVDPGFLDGRIMAFWITLLCIALYVGVSLAGRAPAVSLHELLHREPAQRPPGPLRLGPEVPRGDRRLIPLLYAGIGLAVAAFAGVSLYNAAVEVPTARWLAAWPLLLGALFVGGSLFVVAITWGGLRDLRRMLAALRARRHDPEDDGRV